MSELADILIEATGLKGRKADALRKEIARLQGVANDAGTTVRRAGYIATGNTTISPADGVKVFNPTTGRPTVNLEPDGDAFLGSDLTNPATTSFIVFSSDQAYNDEAMGEGDVLLGDNSTGKANLLWDRSEGKLKFRGGQSSNAYIDVDGTLVAVGAILSGTMQSANYAEGASGWKIDEAGDAEFNNATVRGVLQTTVFKKDTVNVSGGDLLILPGDVLDADMTQFDISTLTLKGNITLAVGDVLRLRDGVNDEWLTVTGIASAPTYTVTRDRAGAYAANTNPAWKAGTAVANYQTSGSGGLLLSAGGPYLRVFTHNGSPWTGLQIRGQFGQLNGSYGYLASTFGTALGDPAAANVTIDPSGGFKLRYGTTNYIVLDNTGGKITGALAVTGTLSAGSGAVTLSATGLSIQASSAGGEIEKQIKFPGGLGTPIGVIDAYEAGSGINNYFAVSAKTYNGKTTDLVLETPGDVQLFSDDFYTYPWTDYSASSTITGWSSFTNKEIYYKKIGKLVFVAFQLDGTSNSTSAIFSLPYSATSSGPALRFPVQSQNNGGVFVFGMGLLDPGSNAVDLRKDPDGGSYTASGTKSVRGQFWYEAA
jgi:hypothetical protein